MRIFISFIFMFMPIVQAFRSEMTIEVDSRSFVGAAQSGKHNTVSPSGLPRYGQCISKQLYGNMLNVSFDGEGHVLWAGRFAGQYATDMNAPFHCRKKKPTQEGMLACVGDKPINSAMHLSAVTEEDSVIFLDDEGNQWYKKPDEFKKAYDVLSEDPCSGPQLAKFTLNSYNEGKDPALGRKCIEFREKTARPKVCFEAIRDLEVIGADGNVIHANPGDILEWGADYDVIPKRDFQEGYEMLDTW